MAAGFGYSADTPEGCWDDLAERIAPGLLGRSFATVEEIAELAGSWTGSRFAVAGAETACWDLLGQARHATHRRAAGRLGEQLGLGVESGLAVGLYPTIVELLQAIETHLAEGYRRVKIKIQPGQRRRARPRGPPALRRRPPDGRRQRRVHRRRPRRLPRARRATTC